MREIFLREYSMTTDTAASLSAKIGASLPYLRRYARALTGSQDSGDRFSATTLEALLEDMSPMAADPEPKVALFRAFHLVWSSAGAPVDTADSQLSARAQAHMADLTPLSREALLLVSIEGFTLGQAGRVLGITEDEAGRLVNAAIEEMQSSVRGAVMIIEDEAIIALDIADIVGGIGHRITGIARTRAEAVRLAAADRPDLVLADIQLADNSSGIDAVNDILARIPDTPVIFITAFPERLLTGKRPEPAFLITKPFTEEQVRSAVSQAMFFASTETLSA